MRFVSYSCAFVTSLVLSGAVIAASNELRTVVLTGQPAPGTPGFTFDRTSESFHLNDAGQVAFVAPLRNGPSVAGLGIWLDNDGSQALVARTQTAAPGTATNFTDMGNGLALNNLGHVAFRGHIDTPDHNDTGIWSDAAGNLQLVVLEGDPAPNIPQRSFGEMFQLSLADDGQVAFSSLLPGFPLTSTVYRGNAQGLSLVARGETQAPGTVPGTMFMSRSSFGLTRNKPGDLLLSATLFGPDVTSANATGLWTDRTAPLTLVARNGDTAPASVPQATIARLTPPAMNDLGQIALTIGLAGPGVNPTNDAAILFEDHGATQLLVKTGDPAPGAAPGTVFSGFHSPVPLNNAGEIVFRADISGGDATNQNSLGLWSGTPDNLRLVARLGDPAPGVAGGATFRARVQEGFPILYTLNDRGQTAFMAQLTGPGITAANDLGIWATDVNGTLHLIAREGDSLEVAPNDFRVISELFVRNFTTNKSVMLNNRGQIAFDARLVDGTAIFISNAVAIPEPATALPFLSLAILAFHHRRHRMTLA